MRGCTIACCQIELKQFALHLWTRNCWSDSSPNLISLCRYFREFICISIYLSGLGSFFPQVTLFLHPMTRNTTVVFCLERSPKVSKVRE